MEGVEVAESALWLMQQSAVVRTSWTVPMWAVAFLGGAREWARNEIWSFVGSGIFILLDWWLVGMSNRPGSTRRFHVGGL